ncbi:MAG: hypothetical protein EP343_08555 [Deltaproteobacteria bacterium]|nr:MAG: hypothetical protein EP343_08555 [Deltaproteobacteria bacterium]
MTRKAFGVKCMWWLPLGMLWVWVLVGSSVGCGGEIQVTLPGCEDCPNRCLRESDKAGKCVACLNDKQCQTESAPTNRCTDENVCVCGTDKDCGNGYCNISTGRCVECLEDKNCQSPDKPFCIRSLERCGECKPGDIQGCAPSDIQVCVKGTQQCKSSGEWAPCEGWEACKNCPSVPCAVGEIQCKSQNTVTPGKYVVCEKDQDGCPVWSTQEKTCTGANEVCDNGACVDKSCPPQECTAGATRCADKDNIQTCGKDSTGCLVWQPKQPCPSGATCSDKTQTCTSCEPKEEVCNQKDDNCDGKPDETFTDLGQACEVGKGLCKASGTKICSNDGKTTVCSASAGTPAKEICNGKDDDCDGTVDNGNLCPNNQPCNNGICGTPEPGCADGTRELFTNMQKFPLITGCKGYFRGESLRKSRTNQSCGASENQACPAAEDLCAKGWHICAKNGDPNDLKTRVSGDDCATAGAGLFVAASSHCINSKPQCSYMQSGSLPCTPGGLCSEAICCGSDCQKGTCTSAVWPNKTLCARPKSFIGCANGNSFHGSPTLSGVLCCKDTP